MGAASMRRKRWANRWMNWRVELDDDLQTMKDTFGDILSTTKNGFNNAITHTRNVFDTIDDEIQDFDDMVESRVNGARDQIENGVDPNSVLDSFLCAFIPCDESSEASSESSSVEDK